MVSVNVTSTAIGATVSSAGSVSVSATQAGSIVAVGSAYQPASHAASHGAGGSDEISISQSQVESTLGNGSLIEDLSTILLVASSASNISSGTLSSQRLPVATTTAVGAVAVGTGLSMVGGTALRANVVSVNGKTGVVSLVASDISAADGDHSHGPIAGDGTVNGEMFFIGDNDTSGSINGGTAYLSGIVFSGNLSSQNTAFTGSAGALTSGTLSIDRLPVIQDKSSSLGNTGSSLTLSLSSASVQRATLSANCTFTMPTATAGASLILILTQGGTGNTATFTSVKWPGGSAPTVTATNGKVDVLRFVSDGTSWYGFAHQNY